MLISSRVCARPAGRVEAALKSVATARSGLPVIYTRMSDVGPGCVNVPRGKVGVEHTSWPHYILTTKKIETSSYGNQPDILDAVSRGEVVAGFVTDAYVGWYLKQHPGAVKIAGASMPDADFRWNVAIRLLDADQALADAVSQSLDRLIADRTIPGIFTKYGITYVPPSTP